MKKLFKKLLAVALVGAMVGFVGCKDYDDDIDALNNRLDGIENNQIKGINDQIASMQSSISSLQSAQSATQAAVETLKTTVATLTAKHDADIQDLKGADIELQAQISVLEAAIKALEAKDADLQAQIDSINETMKTMASMSWVEATLEAYATSEEVAAAIGELEAWLGEIGIRLANLESQVAELQILGDEHAKAIDAANAKIEALQAQLDKAIEDLMAWVGEQLSGYITASYFEGYMTEYTAKIVSTLEEISNAIEDDYKEYTDEAVKNAVEAFKAQVVATLEEMSNAIEADRARDLEALKEQIVATLEEMSNAIEADRKRDLTALQEAIVAQLEEMSTAIEADRARDIQDALDKVVAQLEETSNAIEHDYKEYADAAVAQLRDDVVNTLMEMSAGIEEDMKKLQGVIEENYTAAIEAALAQVVTTLEQMSEAIEADRARDLAALKEQVVATLEEMSEAIEADYKKEIAAAIENNNGVLRAEFTDAMAKLSEMLDKFITDTQKQLLAANINIEALMNRIQSIVYVPDYEDLMATVPGIIGYNDDPTTQSHDAWLVGEGEVYMNFRVTPANLAMKVAAVGKEHFTFMLQGLKTRAAEYGLEVLDVAYNPAVEDGLFTVVAQPTLPLEFYQGAKNYAVSLVLDVTNAEVQKKEDNAAAGTATSIMTSYVKLYADTYQLVDIKPGKVVDGDVELVDYKEYTIDWDDVETKIELLKGYEPYLVFNNAKPIAYATAKAEYTLPELTQRVMSNVAFDLSEDKDFEDLGNFVFADEKEDACEEVVSLKEAKKEFLGDYLTTEHVYGFAQRAADEDDAFQVVNGGFVSEPIFTKVTIVKPTVTLQLAPVTYYWWYQDYSTFFAAGKPYEGAEFAGTTFKSYVTAGVLPKGVTPSAIAGGQHVAYLKGEDGEYNSSIVRVRISASGEDEDGVYFSLGIKNWAFNKDYSVKVTKELEAIDVNFVFDASFVGLPEKLTYSLGDVTIPYKAGAMTLTTEVAKEDKGKALEAIYAQVGADKEIKKYFAKVDEFVSLVMLLDDTEYVSTLDIDATRVSGGDEETATVVADVTREFAPSGPSSVGNTGIMVPNDPAADLFDAFFKVYTNNVVTDADVFTMNTTLTTQPGMKIEFTGSAAIEMPAYRVRHSQTWVADPTEENNFFHSYVKGLWGPSMDLLQALTSFSTADIELESAFILQELKDGKWQDAASTPAGVSFKYTINEKPGTFKGIEIDETTNFLTYNGTNESVNVVGELFVDHVKISDAFNYPTRNYLSYRVFKYDPLGDLKEIAPVTVDINTAAGQGEYTYNIWASLSIKDLRGAEIVNRAAAKKSENMWMNENYSDEFGKSVVTLFGIDQTTTIDGYTNTHGLQIGNNPLAIYQDTSAPADGLEGRITITDGRITFSNLNNLAIQRNIEVRVPVKVLYTWGVKEGYVTYIIQK